MTSVSSASGCTENCRVSRAERSRAGRITSQLALPLEKKVCKYSLRCSTRYNLQSPHCSEHLLFLFKELLFLRTLTDCHINIGKSPLQIYVFRHFQFLWTLQKPTNTDCCTSLQSSLPSEQQGTNSNDTLEEPDFFKCMCRHLGSIFPTESGKVPHCRGRKIKKLQPS